MKRQRSEQWLLTDGCEARRFASENKKLIWEAVMHNVAVVCSRCSGAVCCDDLVQVFHPTAHLTAEQIVQSIAG